MPKTRGQAATTPHIESTENSKRGRDQLSSPESLAVIKNPILQNKETILQSVGKLGKIEEIVETTSANLSTVMDDITVIKSDISGIGQKLEKAQQDITSLQNDYDTLSAEVNQINQANLITSFTVFGLPIIKQEEAFDVMKKLVTKVGGSVKKEEFKKLFVVYHRDKATSHLVGRFYDERKRYDIFNKFRNSLKAKKPVLVEDICANLAPDSTLRGKEARLRTQLTNYNKQLYDNARKFATDFDFKWESDGRILLRKNPESKPIEVRTHRQLVNIVASQQGTSCSSSNVMATQPSLR